ncbi:MAG: ATP-binding cassette domain-containing protein [Ignavibacteriales bacterium]|nr:ATP-binding cassette domain-containing protein [Ignavibacteriales bacterium]
MSFIRPARRTSCGLIGPNGAGKTTIIKLIMNLVRRDAGEIRVFGLDNRVDEVAVKSRIGFVYDVPGFWDDRDARHPAPRARRRSTRRWSDATLPPPGRRVRPAARQDASRRSRTATKMKFALAMALVARRRPADHGRAHGGTRPDLQAGAPRAPLGAAAGRRQVGPLLDAHHERPRARGGLHHVRQPGRGRVLAAARPNCSTPGPSCAGTRPSAGGLAPAIVRGRRAGRFGTEVLVSDAREAARTAGPAAVVDRPSLEDVDGAHGRGVRSCFVALFVKDLRLNPHVFWGALPFFAWVAYALREDGAPVGMLTAVSGPDGRG